MLLSLDINFLLQDIKNGINGMNGKNERRKCYMPLLEVCEKAEIINNL